MYLDLNIVHTAQQQQHKDGVAERSGRRAAL
jgi:hypothetical protein